MVVDGGFEKDVGSRSSVRSRFEVDCLDTRSWEW